MSEKLPPLRPADLLFKGRRKAISNGRCVECYCKATEFRNDISVREYHISGLCQACQDSVFGEGLGMSEKQIRHE